MCTEVVYISSFCIIWKGKQEIVENQEKKICEKIKTGNYLAMLFRCLKNVS